VHAQIIHHHVNFLDRGRNPRIHLLQEIGPVASMTSRVALREGFSSLGTEDAKDIALAMMLLLDFHLGSLRPHLCWSMGVNQLLPWIALASFRP
jgi:hypothetical protein